MTCNITTTPRLMEPLPAYSPRIHDSDAASISSAAPSYTSAAPSYHTSVPRPTHTRYQSVPIATSSTTSPSNGLPSVSSYPGRSLGGSIVSDLNSHRYNIPSWASVGSSPQSRHYHSVASGRATMSSLPKALGSLSSPSVTFKAAELPAGCCEIILEEDPYLVGEEAAAKAREDRLARRQRGEEVLRQEDKKWDFFVAQMADWEERERSWKRFRNTVEREGKLRRVAL